MSGTYQPMSDNWEIKVNEMGHEGRPVCVEWKISTTPVDDQTLEPIGNTHVSEDYNLVVNSGRTRLMSLAFIPSASAAGGFYFLGVGASSTTAQVADTRLTYELVGNLTRKSLVNSNNLTPGTGDIQLQTITISGVTFYEYLVLQATYLTTDGNNNNTFAEYGIFDSGTLPGTPTATSGTMFNHFIDPNPATKSSTNQVQASITIRM